jgi:protein tyrosine/serine phosphatase
MAFRKSIPYLLGIAIAITIVVAPLWYAWHRSKELRNLHIVKPGVLYRSGQLSVKRLQRLMLKHQIKTVITFRQSRTEGEPHPDVLEESFCRTAGYNYFRIPWRDWQIENGEAKADQSVRKFIAIMRDAKNHPVLIHCYAGKHRTGAFSAVYRMEFDNWSGTQAIKEMQACGYDNIEEHSDLYGYIMSYRRGRLQPDTINDGLSNTLTSSVNEADGAACECCKDQ